MGVSLSEFCGYARVLRPVIDQVALARAPKAAQLYGLWPPVSPGFGSAGKIVFVVNQQLRKSVWKLRNITPVPGQRVS
jgi:hypothetical protein